MQQRLSAGVNQRVPKRRGSDDTVRQLVQKVLSKRKRILNLWGKSRFIQHQILAIMK
jgi:hypothetical protein